MVKFYFLMWLLKDVRDIGIEKTSKVENCVDKYNTRHTDNFILKILYASLNCIYIEALECFKKKKKKTCYVVPNTWKGWRYIN